jgi:type I restriction enzyme S subunit
MSFEPIGKHIKLVDERNIGLQITNLLGINITKNFMPSVANVSETDLSKYKILKKGQFAYSAMQVGRDETIRIALYSDDKPAIISPAYSVIETDENALLPEYLMMCFQRPESDRYGWFISDSSVRASLEYERLCEIKIPIPSIEEQKKYVALYQGLLSNQKAYEKSLGDLQLICDTYIENLIKTEEHKRLGNYIEQSDARNYDLKIDLLRGVSTGKILIESKANISGVSFSNYKIVKNGQFVYVSDTSRRGEKIALAMNMADDCIVSSIYTVFDIIDKNILLPEYLYLWFVRSEFDRYARFNSWGSARETFDWSDMCNIKLPIPDIKVQEAIVTIYHTLETRKRINAQLKQSIKPLCPILCKGVVDNLEKRAVV